MNWINFGRNSLPANINMALEEYSLQKSSEGAGHIRFFDMPKDVIVLGYAQSPDVHKQSIDIVRRVTGGSHVLFSENTMAYSISVPRDGSFKNHQDMRKEFLGKIEASFRNLGIDATTDLQASATYVDDKIIAGHAMIWGVESALIHGLINITPFDMIKMEKYVKLKSRKIGSNLYSEKDVISKLPAVSDFIKKDKASKNEICRKILIKSIVSEVTSGKHENKSIDNIIINQSIPLLEKRYGKEVWNLKHNPEFSPEQIEEIPGEELKGNLKKDLGYCYFTQVKDSDFKEMAFDN